MTEQENTPTCANCEHFTRIGIQAYCKRFRLDSSHEDAACQEWHHHLTGAPATPRKEKAK